MVFCDATIQACSGIKAVFGLPMRQTTGSVARFLRPIGVDWSVPDFRKLCPRQKTLSVNPRTAVPRRS
ncbi:transposase [Leisingera sp. SS27]|uniref:transposase n=1 Tax=Leisingera sp. SS27 TaxID=2979462 RepID=UPI003FA56D89